MMQPDIQPGSQPGAVWTGTDAQRTDLEQKQLRGRLMTDQSLDPREKLAIEMENSGVKVPAGVFGPKPTTHLVPVAGPKGPIYQNEADAEGQPVYEKPTKDPSDHFSPVPQYDEQGRPIGTMSFDTRRGTAAPVVGPDGQPLITRATPGAAQNATKEQGKRDALGALDQLDQSIDAAAPMIGPGEGRISSLEQMVGNADPKIQALGTKMLLAKMKVDAGIGGMRAAASPQLLSRWDNLLANKVTPEGLKAAVQAMREIVGGGADSGSHPDLQKFGAVYKWDGSKYVKQ
jgi:hypothetical protein